MSKFYFHGGRKVQVGYIDVQGGYIGVQGGYMLKRISSFKGYLSHSSSRVEFELELGLRLTNKLGCARVKLLVELELGLG